MKKIKLSKNQEIILNYIKEQGGKHVYIGITLKANWCAGWDWHEVERPLKGLIKRGILTVTSKSFYHLVGQ
jgi:hypothetical protein